MPKVSPTVHSHLGASKMSARMDCWRQVALALLLGLAAQAQAAGLLVEDPLGALRGTGAPVSLRLRLTNGQRRAAMEGCLGLVAATKRKELIPVQWQFAQPEPCAIWLMPAAAVGTSELRLRVSPKPFAVALQAVEVPGSGQVELREGSQTVLQYNYRTVEPKAGFPGQVSAANRIYARPRSDYIHPLFGPHGEELTRDWSPDHPHHRGIYWAWPEIGFGTERGDLHALQKVFARPTGRIRLRSGPVFAQVTAENEWRWNDGEPIVREVVLIRAFRAAGPGRVIDLAFRFVALKDGVTLARRDTDKYGGLNVRMATPDSQQILPCLDAPTAVPCRAWSDLSGRFPGPDALAGLTVLQHRANPEYPGDWIQYPNLSWCQPTFPRAGTRFPLARGQPLLLRFRLWVHEGGTPPQQAAARLWDAFNAPAAAALEFEL